MPSDRPDLDLNKLIRRKVRVEVPEDALLVLVRAPEGTSADQAQMWGHEMSLRLKQAKESGLPFVLVLPPAMSIDDVKAIVGVKSTEATWQAEVNS